MSTTSLDNASNTSLNNTPAQYYENSTSAPDVAGQCNTLCFEPDERPFPLALQNGPLGQVADFLGLNLCEFADFVVQRVFHETREALTWLSSRSSRGDDLKALESLRSKTVSALQWLAHVSFWTFEVELQGFSTTKLLEHDEARHVLFREWRVILDNMQSMAARPHPENGGAAPATAASLLRSLQWHYLSRFLSWLARPVEESVPGFQRGGGGPPHSPGGFASFATPGGSQIVEMNAHFVHRHAGDWWRQYGRFRAIAAANEPPPWLQRDRLHLVGVHGHGGGGPAGGGGGATNIRAAEGQQEGEQRPNVSDPPQWGLKLRFGLERLIEFFDGSLEGEMTGYVAGLAMKLYRRRNFGREWEGAVGADDSFDFQHAAFRLLVRTIPAALVERKLDLFLFDVERAVENPRYRVMVPEVVYLTQRGFVAPLARLAAAQGFDPRGFRIGGEKLQKKKRPRVSNLKKLIRADRYDEAQEAREKCRECFANNAQRTSSSTARRTVRHYVHSLLSKDFDEKIKALLLNLNSYQERARERDLALRRNKAGALAGDGAAAGAAAPGAKAKRLVLGLREIERGLKREKLIGLIVAPDLDKSATGLDATIESLMEKCLEKQIPLLFALSRREMGYVLKRLKGGAGTGGPVVQGVSAVGLLSVEGQNREWKAIVKQAEELKTQWVQEQMMQSKVELA
eukprot:g2812.t1